jgi:DnaK suppressor protein
MANTAPIEHSTVKPYKAKKGEEYMSEGQIQHFTEILENWKTELMS